MVGNNFICPGPPYEQDRLGREVETLKKMSMVFPKKKKKKKTFFFSHYIFPHVQILLSGKNYPKMGFLEIPGG